MISISQQLQQYCSKKPSHKFCLCPPYFSGFTVPCDTFFSFGTRCVGQLCSIKLDYTQRMHVFDKKQLPQDKLISWMRTYFCPRNYQLILLLHDTAIRLNRFTIVTDFVSRGVSVQIIVFIVVYRIPIKKSCGERFSSSTCSCSLLTDVSVAVPLLIIFISSPRHLYPFILFE